MPFTELNLLTPQLSRIAASLAPEKALHDDLLQEALLHFWQMELRCPGQSRSWYLQSCRFRLQHYLGAGRSIDSLKRRAGRVTLAIEDDDGAELETEPFLNEPDLAQCASANDLIEALSAQVGPLERRMILLMAEDRSLTEVAEMLDISLPTARKYRNKIAAAALKIGIEWPPKKKTDSPDLGRRVPNPFRRRAQAPCRARAAA